MIPDFFDLSGMIVQRVSFLFLATLATSLGFAQGKTDQWLKQLFLSTCRKFFPQTVFSYNEQEYFWWVK